MQTQDLIPVGIWQPDSRFPAFTPQELPSIISQIREPVHIIREGHGAPLGLAQGGYLYPYAQNSPAGYLLMATLPAIYPEWLGDRTFLETHGTRFPYVAGAMYRGIASAEMVIAMAQAGMIGFFGAAGLPIGALEKALDTIQAALDPYGLPYGSNLIHSPQEPELEEAVVDLYLQRGVTRVSAAAFMNLSPSVVRYACSGLYQDEAGYIHRKNYVFAKLSRPEIAEMFMAPPPADILNHLVEKGVLTTQEATLAAYLPVAEDITVEADSGGHTDNRPLTAIFPTVLDLRNQMMQKYQYTRPIRIGAAGGIGTPAAVAAAFSLGAAYVLTGSVNQSAVEAGMSLEARKMLGVANVVDVCMAPAADMFELGVKVQVLKRGTLFSGRAAKLYSIYSAYDSIEAMPANIKAKLEKETFRAPLEQIWEDTKRFFAQRNPEELEKANADAKYKMALIFRWYLGNTAFWAIEGDPAKRIDYQICCGPSIGAFNAWAKGSFMEDVENRTVAGIALNLLEGAAIITRAQQLRTYGVPVPGEAFNFQPRPLS